MQRTCRFTLAASHSTGGPCHRAPPVESSVPLRKTRDAEHGQSCKSDLQELTTDTGTKAVYRLQAATHMSRSAQGEEPATRQTSSETDSTNLRAGALIIGRRSAGCGLGPATRGCRGPHRDAGPASGPARGAPGGVPRNPGSVALAAHMALPLTYSGAGGYTRVGSGRLD